eukprot:1376902-Pleurochrysis_carterae.AAC.1
MCWVKDVEPRGLCRPAREPGRMRESIPQKPQKPSTLNAHFVTVDRPHAARCSFLTQTAQLLAAASATNAVLIMQMPEELRGARTLPLQPHLVA